MACKCEVKRQLDVTAKCSDLFFFYNVDTGAEYEGYVPSSLGIGSGDYVEFTICLNCGFLNGTWPRPEGAEECAST